MKILPAVFILLIFLTTSASAEERVYVIHKPKEKTEEVRSVYENKQYEFGFDLAEGFQFDEYISEEGSFTLDIFKDGYPIQAALVIEEFEEDMSASGYWQQMLDDNPNMESVVVYERKTEIEGIPAIQVRLEEMISGSYLLYVSILFTDDDRGYFISVFCDSLLYEEVPDFFEEIIDGFYFLEDEDENSDTDGDTEASPE